MVIGEGGGKGEEEKDERRGGRDCPKGSLYNQTTTGRVLVFGIESSQTFRNAVDLARIDGIQGGEL